jgi:hypothetical protein
MNHNLKPNNYLTLKPVHKTFNHTYLINKKSFFQFFKLTNIILCKTAHMFNVLSKNLFNVYNKNKVNLLIHFILTNKISNQNINKI